MCKALAALWIMLLLAAPGFASSLRLVMFDGFEDNGCKHGILEEQVIRNFAPNVSFEITRYSVTHGANCDQFDSAKLNSLLNSTIQFAKTDRVVVYFGYAFYGRIATWDKPLGELAKRATIVVGAGNEANDSCKHNWLSPFAVVVGSAKDGAIESYSGRGACTDLYLDYGGSLTVVIDGHYYGVSGTSTSSAIVASEALTLWSMNPQALSIQINTALSLGERLLKTDELMTAPRIEATASQQLRSVSVSGRAFGPVSSVAVYRGLPSATRACKGKPLSTLIVRRDSTFTAVISVNGTNLCFQPKPFGPAVGTAIQ